MNSFLDESTGYLTHVAGLLLKRELLDAIKKSNIDITPEQWAVLNRLSENQGQSQRKLAAASFKDTANITRIIDKLETKGLVQRKGDPGDRRARKIYITSKGQQVRDMIEPLAIDVLVKAGNKIDQSDIEVYNKVAKKIIANLER